MDYFRDGGWGMWLILILFFFSAGLAAARPKATRSSILGKGAVAVIAAGGALGSLARWGLGDALGRAAAGFPWATLIENVSGSLALAVLMVLVAEVRPSSRYLRPFAGVGLLGGWTTFSTYALDTRTLIADDRVLTALLYVGSSLLLGLLAHAGDDATATERRQAVIDVCAPDVELRSPAGPIVTASSFWRSRPSTRSAECASARTSASVNSSPPMRPAMSPARSSAWMWRASLTSASSPTAWPHV